MTTETKTQLIPLDRIFADESLQIRCETDGDQIDNLVDAIGAGAELPAIDLFAKDEFADPSYLIGDGWHRYYAHIRAGKKEIRAIVHPGGRPAALKFALGANAAHGLRRTNADKRRAVEVAIKEFPKLSARAIADLCKVSPQTAATIKKQVSNLDTCTGADGKEYPAAPAAKPQLTPEEEVKKLAEKAFRQIVEPVEQLELTFGDDIKDTWLPHIDPAVLPTVKARLKDLSDKVEALIRAHNTAKKGTK